MGRAFRSGGNGHLNNNLNVDMSEELKISEKLKDVPASQYDVQELAKMIKGVDWKITLFISEMKNAKELDKQELSNIKRRVDEQDERIDINEEEIRDLRKFQYMIVGGFIVVQIVIQFLLS